MVTRPDTKMIYLEQYKYFKNFIEMPIAGILFLLGVVLVLYGFILGIFKKSTKAIWYAGYRYHNYSVCFVYQSGGSTIPHFIQAILICKAVFTIENGSSSLYTLKAMTLVSILVPFVAAYMFWAWKAINNKKNQYFRIK